MIVTIAQMKEHLNITADFGSADDVLISRMLSAAQGHLERLLGFQIEVIYPPSGTPAVSTVPAALIECVCQLAAHWYENREATLVGVTAQELPFGVWEIVREYREYSFDA